MNKVSILLVLISFTSSLVFGQSDNHLNIPNNTAINFYNSSGGSDGTVMYRSDANALVFKVEGILNYRMMTDAVFRIKNSSNSTKISFDVDGDSYLNGGNVGIGLTTPVDGQLHVYRNATTGSWTTFDKTNATLHIEDSGYDMYLDGNTVFSTGNAHFGTIENKYMTLGTNKTERVRVDENGLVGIGSTAPGFQLHVMGDPAADANFNDRQILGYFEQKSTGTSEAGVAIKGARYSSTALVSYLDLDIHDKDETVTDFTMARMGAGKENGSGTNGQLRFFTNDNGSLTEQLRIKSNGDIGIGTTTPDAKLTVKGEIHAEGVTIDLSIPAPDYVFEEDYNLRSLEQTAEYIKLNKHLPEVPSAKELEENGLDLEAMNLLLLKKIEELTLHVIELKKQNDEQAQRLENLENQ